MKFNHTIDANAVSLSMKNFGYLPEVLHKTWIEKFFKADNKTQLPMPKKLIVELANTCNLDCPMCRVGQYGVNLKRIIPLDVFEKLLDNIPNLATIRLNGLGESTLIPHFDKYLKAIFDRNIVVELITNGSGNSAYYESILDHRGVVLISWDAAEKKVFEQLRRPANWEIYVEKLENLAAYAQQTAASERLFLLFTLQKSNIEQLPLLVTQCFEWDVKNIIVNVVKLDNNNWLVDKLEHIKEIFKAALHIADIKNIALLLPNEIEKHDLQIKEALKTSACGCLMPWEEAVIRWNGDVQVCNMFNPYTYGNIFINDFSTIWNNAFANLFRQFINTQNRHPYCEGCVYIKDAYDYRKT